jgi:CSLREA domain-containing protein
MPETAPARRWTLLAALALVVVAAPAAATQIVVTTTADETTTDGDCSLREAFIAANTNAPRDACPAGSNTVEDEIVLADEARYALTIPSAGNDNGFTGTLTVLNGGATFDLEVTVANDGVATIAQDAVPDTGVLQLALGATLDLEGVVVEGGTLTGTSRRGAGILVGNGARLTLSRCVIRENRAEDSGGGIRSTGTVIIQDSVLENNSSGTSGGALSTGSNSTTIIDGTLFANNTAGSDTVFGFGGAIESSEPLTVTDSVFVNNRARAGGGAVAHFDDVANTSSIAQSCFIGNAGVLDGNAVMVFDGSEELAANGNWWGADDGPSGEGPGDGDGVSAHADFSAFEVTPLPGCLPLEMVANGGFQLASPGGGQAVPARWTTVLGPNDGRVCFDDDACIVKMRGNGTGKQALHVIEHAGAAGDDFTFKARSRAKDVPTGQQAYRATATFFHTDGSQQSFHLNFSAGSHAFERKTRQISAAKDYARIVVGVFYGRTGGVVRFDSVSLLLNGN